MTIQTRVGKFLQTFIALLVLFFCSFTKTNAAVSVCATTSLVADLVKRIGGKHVTVYALMGPGVDPHLYKATASDVIELNRCQIIFYNGLHLEGRMTDIFENLTKKGKKVVAISQSIPKENLITLPGGSNQYDPHIWFDPRLWQQCAEVVGEQLSEMDPDNKDVYLQNARVFQSELQELFKWGSAQAQSLPANKRIMITSHDAYNYFGKAFDFVVIGVQGVSTTSEAGLADVVSIIDFIKKNKVRAIFVESSVSPATIERIAKDSGAKIGGELFSDALGASNDIRKVNTQGIQSFNVGTYEGMFKYNMLTIVQSLK